ncbi:unnamed protein product [Phytophthora lilii]|uniref:Unnamed protein product n=1 Tax=Phytophthora lilii TaxID=2077276 RepID=A0A9W6UEQ8_9STRA|nr:unnamed protein product [Phytophthora lilii]
MKSIKDLLIWYNNLDVVPFTKAIKAQRELLKRFDLDMFADGVSLPGLSEKVMYQTCFNNLQCPDKKPANAFQFSAKRMAGYKSQDAKAKRNFGVTLEHVNTLLQKQKYLCGLCYCQLTADTGSVMKIRGGKVCKKIIGYDANALYLWALGNEMPCGRLTTVEAYDGIIDDIKADKVFGFLECDIRTPEHLKQYFGEMTPIFKNILIEAIIWKYWSTHRQ